MVEVADRGLLSGLHQRLIMVYSVGEVVARARRSEVDLNGSLWYIIDMCNAEQGDVLKLTSTGHYGICSPS